MDEQFDELKEQELQELYDRQNELWNELEYYDNEADVQITLERMTEIYDELDEIDEKIKLLW